ncbi:MAG: hypothetical protein AAGH17_01405 [Pseudomonadota bacterium]
MQYSKPSSWASGPDKPASQAKASGADIGWQDMLVEAPYAHAHLCQKGMPCLATAHQICIKVDDTDPQALVQNTEFLNSLISLGVRCLDIPVHRTNIFALRQLCLAVFAQNPSALIRLAPRADHDRAVTTALCDMFPDQVILSDAIAPLRLTSHVDGTECTAGTPQPRLTQPKAVKHIHNQPDTAAHAAHSGVTVLARQAMTITGAHPQIAISRNWSITLGRETSAYAGTSAPLGYEMVRHPSRQQHRPWVRFTTASAGAQDQRLIALGVTGNNAIIETPLRVTAALDDGRLLASGDADLAPGSFALDEAGCFVGIVQSCGDAPDGSDANKHLILLPVTAIWADLAARADLGSAVACAALSDLSYIRDRTINPKPRRSRRRLARA